MKLSKDQKEVLASIVDWHKKKNKPYLTIGGYAGTGKTTMIAHIRSYLHEKYKQSCRVAFACFTGKASQVLGKALVKLDAMYPHDYIGTIHGLMYKPIIDAEGKLLTWQRLDELAFDLVIIDEASMVTQDIWNDLRMYGLPILAVGDHGQLPPIGNAFNLMQYPDLTLEKIHRQAKHHPIIALSEKIRNDVFIEYGKHAENVIKLRKDSLSAKALQEKLFSHFHADMMILCGYNKTRVHLNQTIRRMLGKTQEEPQLDDYVICLKNNYKEANDPIFNGMIGRVKAIRPHRKHWYRASIYFFHEKKYHRGKLSKYQFNALRYIDQVKGLRYDRIGDRFDFGYAITVHKSQGSQAKTVLLFDEYRQEQEQKSRWLYTAVTRATDNLYIIG